MITHTYRENRVALGRVMFDMIALGKQPTLASWSTASWSTASADPPTPLPEDLPDPGPGGPGVPGDDRPRSTNPAPKRFDLQTMLAMQRQGLCLNCKGEHRTWQCPEIGDILFADIALGRKLCRMRWRKFPAFVALLVSAHASGHLHAYAASYQAYIRDHRPDSDLTIAQVLEVWERIIAPAIEQAA